LFLAVHKLFERTIFSLVQPMGSSHAASSGSIVARPTGPTENSENAENSVERPMGTVSHLSR
jgi:hypothetical protein